MPRKKRRRYGEYVEIIDGKVYGSVNLPRGDGTYKRKRKRVANEIAARQWAEQQLGLENPTEGFAELAAWYERKYLVPPIYKDGAKVKGLRTWKAQRVALARLTEAFGKYRPNQITFRVLEAYKDKKLETSGIAAVNRDFALLRTLFKKAIRHGFMMTNPFDVGDQLIETALEKSRESQITPRIARRLLARARKSESPLLYYLILVMKNTGGRPSEIYPYEAREGDGILREPLTWKNILDYDFHAVKLVSYKKRLRRERLVPASIELERGLRDLYAKVDPAPEDLVFPQTTFKTAWNTLCRSIRVKGPILRDFRHYFNNELRNRGYDESSRLLILGHEEMKTNLIYSAIDADFIKRYRERE
jgi:integrase